MRVSRALLITVAILPLVVAIAMGLALAFGGSFLRVNSLHHADVILILGGGIDDSRYWRAVELKKARLRRQGRAGR